MPAELSLLAAFIVGLSGGIHCIAMCGGISTALGFAANTQQSRSFLFALSYNAGRIFSYTVIGFLFGALLAVIDAHSAIAHRLLQTLSALLLIAIGLHISGAIRNLAFLESWGAHFWKWLQPLALKLFPVTSIRKALALGLLWGWLPCGLVYSTLAWSATSGSALQSASMMMAFGMGTLPWLLATTFAGQRLHAVAGFRGLRPLLGTLLLGFGLFAFYSSLQGQHASHAAPPVEHSEQFHDHHHH